MTGVGSTLSALMHILRFTSQFFWVLGLSLLAIGAEARDVLTLQQTLAKALERAPDYRGLVAEEIKAHLSEANAKNMYLPKLDAQARHAYSDVTSSSSTSTSTAVHSPWSNSLALSLSENLYDNGDSYRLARISDIQWRIARLNREKGRRDLLRRVALAYFDYSSAAMSLTQQKSQASVLKTQFRNIEGRFRQGLSRNGDYLRIKAQLERAEIAITNQEITLNEKRLRLQEIMGAEDEYDFQVLTPKSGALLGLKFMPVDPLKTAEFQIAELIDKASEIRVTSAQRANWPRLSLKGTYSYNQPQYLGSRVSPADDAYWNLEGSIVLDYGLWDWGSRKRDIEIAESQRLIDSTQQDITRLKVKQALNALAQNSAAVQSTYGKSRQIAKDAEEIYAIVSRSYREGKSTYIDLASALDELLSSRLQVVQLEFRLLQARTELSYYDGTIDEILQQF